jgi:hypothetical protein
MALTECASDDLSFAVEGFECVNAGTMSDIKHSLLIRSAGWTIGLQDLAFTDDTNFRAFCNDQDRTGLS